MRCYHQATYRKFKALDISAESDSEDGDCRHNRTDCNGKDHGKPRFVRWVHLTNNDGSVIAKRLICSISSSAAAVRKAVVFFHGQSSNNKNGLTSESESFLLVNHCVVGRSRLEKLLASIHQNDLTIARNCQVEIRQELGRLLTCRHEKEHAQKSHVA